MVELGTRPARQAQRAAARAAGQGGGRLMAVGRVLLETKVGAASGSSTEDGGTRYSTCAASSKSCGSGSGTGAGMLRSGATLILTSTGRRASARGGTAGARKTTATRKSADRRMGAAMACQRRLISSMVSASMVMVNSTVLLL